MIYHTKNYEGMRSMIVDQMPGEKVQVLKENAPLGMFLHKPGGFVTDKIFKRKFLEENKIRFDTELKGPEDTVFVMQCYGNAECAVHCPEGLYNYNRHDGSISDWQNAGERLKTMGLALQKGIDVFLNSKYGKDFKYIYHLFVFSLEWASSITDSTRMMRIAKSEELKKYRKMVADYLSSSRFAKVNRKSLSLVNQWLYNRIIALSK
jgi:hypothetical protein